MRRYEIVLIKKNSYLSLERWMAELRKKRWQMKFRGCWEKKLVRGGFFARKFGDGGLMPPVAHLQTHTFNVWFDYE